MQRLGCEIGPVGHQDGQQRLQHRVVHADADQAFTQLAPQPLHHHAHHHPSARQHDEARGDLGARNRARRGRGGYRQLEGHQPGGVVEQALGIDDVGHLAGQRQVGGGGGRGHRVGGRDDGAQREGHRQRHGRDQPVDEVPHHHHRQHHQAQGQQQHRAQHVQQVAPRQHARVGKQQRRDEQQQEHLGIDADPVQPRQRRGQHPHDHQEDGQADARPANQCTAGGGDQQQHERGLDDFHGVPPTAGNPPIAAWSWRFMPPMLQRSITQVSRT